VRITLLAFGTRGDIQTLLAFGVGLQRAGHAVQMATQANFCELVESYGLHCVPVAADVRLPGQKEVKTGRLPVYDQYRLAHHYLTQILDTVWDAARDAEALVFSDWGRIMGVHLVEKLAIPAVMGICHPLQMRYLYRETNVYGPALGWLYSRLRKMALWHLGLGRGINAWRRKTLGLPKISFWKSETELKRRQIPLFFAHSPLVFPKPDTWPTWFSVTGYWFLAALQNWRPPMALVDFLADGQPPICIGFSSMADRKVRALADVVLAALAQTQQRAILLSGWSELGKTKVLPSYVYVMDKVPHDWLFPKTAAVVHHGGAGTTAIAMHSGIPQVIIPFTLDQPFWGARVAALGIGPAPLDPRRLTADALAQAMRQATQDSTMQARAAELGHQIRAEDGVGHAVALFEQYLSTRAPIRNL